MGKRSDFPRLRQDRYMTTDADVVHRLQPHIQNCSVFAEPCAGDGDLVKLLNWHGHRCVYACDTEPGRDWIIKRDALTLDAAWRRSTKAKVIITNPPWTRSVLHAMIERLPQLMPCWFLFDADWAHTRQAAPYLDGCVRIVSVGRVVWFGDTPGLENAAWYYFSGWHTGGPVFFGLT